MNKKHKKLKKQLRVRSKIKGTQNRPRLSVFRSNKYVYAQLIDDENKETIIGVSQKNLDKKDKREKKTEFANRLGLFLAEKAIGLKITQVVFDKGQYLYHGRIKAIAESAREGGLKF